MDISKVRFGKKESRAAFHHPLWRVRKILFHLRFVSGLHQVSLRGFSEDLGKNEENGIRSREGGGFIYYKLQNSFFPSRNMMQSFPVVLSISMFGFFIVITFFASRDGDTSLSLRS